jgi:hypothetical protein
MNHRLRRLTVLAVVGLLGGGSYLWAFGPGFESRARAPADKAGGPDASGEPDPDSNAPLPDRKPPRAWVSYAIAAPEIEGLPPNVAPGDRFSLWALWEPPVTRRPKLQRIVEEVYVEAFVPNITSEGVPKVVFLVDPRRVGDIIYADRYGTFSVAGPSHRPM